MLARIQCALTLQGVFSWQRGKTFISNGVWPLLWGKRSFQYSIPLLNSWNSIPLILNNLLRLIKHVVFTHPWCNYINNEPCSSCEYQCLAITFIEHLNPPPPLLHFPQGSLGDSEDNLSGRWLRRHSKNLSCTVVCTSTVIVSSRLLPRFLLHTVR